MLKTLCALSLLCALGAAFASNSFAQTPAAKTDERNSNAQPAANGPTKSETPAASSELDEVRCLLREQQQELEKMRATVTEQSQVIKDLQGRVEQAEEARTVRVIKTSDIAVSDTTANATAQQSAANKPQSSDVDARLSRVEEQVKKSGETLNRQLGSITFSGDVRFRVESIFGQLNALANADNPAILGNPLSARNRLRVRARLKLTGKVSDEFDWGVRLATGSLADTISTNQTLTDFFNRKPFSLDQAYINYSPRAVKGLRIQAGKFETPWTFTEMTIDNDLMPEGLNETYTRNFKHGALKNLFFGAWQLPFLERNSAFVRNSNGTVNVSETSRGGRDLALYGGQLRARFETSKNTALTLSAADLYFSGTQFITPVQFFGSQLQLPVTITIPATATTPAQTVSTVVSIPRDMLVAGNANLGVSIANNNATNRDGHLSSGYNLVDIISRLDITRSKRWPVMLLFDFVTNTQAHDVVVAGTGGANRIIPNNENKGYWAEAQVGKTRERGDLLLDYTFIRIEKDAVLTPFNYSDISQQSDVRVHRFTFAYAADSRVTLSLTGYINQRPNGLLGAFANTPPGSLGRANGRLQFDTIFRF